VFFRISTLSRGELSARDPGPGRKGLVAKGAAIRRRHFLAMVNMVNMEKISDLIVYRQEFLDLPWRFEPLHDPLSSTRRLMRILRPIVQPFVLAVFNVQAHVLARCDSLCGRAK